MRPCAALVTVLLSAAPAWARDVAKAVRAQLENAEAQLGEVTRNVALLAERYIKPQTFQRSYEAHARLSDGQVAYFLQDYTNASIIFFDIVEDPRNRQSPVYEEALFYLAESLYQNRNFVGARKYFGELLQRLGTKYRQQALARVVSMALITGRHDEIDDFYAKLVQAGGEALAPEIPYLYGKSLYDRGLLDRAAAVFAAIPPGSPHHFQARFFLGGIRAREGKNAEAIQAFLEIYKVDPAAARGADPAETKKIVARNQRVLELTHLALGRIHYELGDLDRAALAYQEVNRQSDLFPEALYELAWIWIKGKQHDKARRSLEILMLSRQDLQFIPEAQILLGNLQLLLDRLDEAEQTYNAVKGTFEPVRRELQALIARHDDPVRYFRSLLTDKLARLDPSAMLPPIATRWVKAGFEVTQAMQIVKDVAQSRKQIEESRQIIARLEAALSAPDKLEIFPLIREGRAVALELESKAVQAKRVLTYLLSLLVQGELSPDEKAALAPLQAAREAAEEAFRKTPRTQEDFFKRREEQQKKVADLEVEAHKLSLAIDGLRAQLVALVKYLDDLKAAKALKPEQEKDLLGRIGVERRSVQELEARSQELRTRAAAARARAGVGDEAAEPDRLARRRYEEAVDRERAALDAARARLTGEKRGLADRMEALRARLAGDLQSLASFQERLRALVDVKAAEVVEKIAAEKRLVMLHERELAAQEAKSENVVGQVAYQSYKGVQQKFYQLVVKADSGLAEITWREKEKRTRRVKQLVQDKKTELKVLTDEFQDVLKEE